MEEETDVLVIGAGPSGLTTAMCLLQQGLKVIIVDIKNRRTEIGRADGLEPRTLEILDSFGLLESFWKRANRTVELSVWVIYALFARLSGLHTNYLLVLEPQPKSEANTSAMQFCPGDITLLRSNN